VTQNHNQPLTEHVLFQALEQFQMWRSDARGKLEVHRLEEQIQRIKSVLGIFHASRLREEFRQVHK
jgi:hypothetical protein